MKFFLSAGADINARGPEGKTALAVAAQMMHRGYVMFLLRRGADTNIADANGAGPLLLAAASCGEGRVEPRTYFAILRALSATTTSMEQRDARGLTALMWAAISNIPEAAVALLEKKADLETRSTDGRTALIWAACAGADATIKELLAHGANREARDEQGRTALDWAKILRERVADQLAAPGQAP